MHKRIVICSTFNLTIRRKIIPYNHNLKQLARKLRNDCTPGEALLWTELKNKQFYNFDFRRQKPLLNYIVDFYCCEPELVIEIDGIYHMCEETDIKDDERDAELSEYGLTVIRFWEDEVRKDMINVLRTMECYLFKKFPELEI